MRQPGILLTMGLLWVVAGVLGVRYYGVSASQANLPSYEMSSDQFGASVSVFVEILGAIMLSGAIAVALVQRRRGGQVQPAATRSVQSTRYGWGPLIIVAMCDGLGGIIISNRYPGFSPGNLMSGIMSVLVGVFAALEGLARPLPGAGGIGPAARKQCLLLAGIMLALGVTFAAATFGYSPAWVASNAEVQGSFMALTGTMTAGFVGIGVWALFQAFRAHLAGVTPQCPKCQSGNIVMIEDKTSLPHFVDHVPTYAKIRQCEDCGHKF